MTQFRCPLQRRQTATNAAYQGQAAQGPEKARCNLPPALHHNPVRKNPVAATIETNPQLAR